jgi:hypothetical protein
MQALEAVGTRFRGRVNIDEPVPDTFVQGPRALTAGNRKSESPYKHGCSENNAATYQARPSPSPSEALATD